MVWWDIDGAEPEDIAHTAVHWDTASRANGDMDFNDYANMVLGVDGSPDSEYLAEFNVPNPSTRVYFIVHAIMLEEDFYAEMEYSIPVYAMPVVGNVDFEEKVETGGKITVTFTITGVAKDRISHVGLHWDTQSHGTPLDFEAYANTEALSPNDDGSYEVSFNAPDKEGNVYFVVHSIIDGDHHYAEDTEFMVKVEKKADDGGLSTTTLIAIAVIVIIFLAILAFAMMNRGGDEE
jgi:hypothetical protein